MIKKTRTRFAILLFLLIIFFPALEFNLTSIEADGVPIKLDNYGNLVPKNDTNLQMIEADVLFIIKRNKTMKNAIDVIFEATFKIHNPNETVNELIGVPFSYIDIDALNSSIVKINNSLAEYEIISIESLEESPWNEYLYFPSERDLIVSNVTFLTKTTTICYYKFDYTVSKEIVGQKTDYGAFEINYDVGTARAWSGNISEIVDFRIVETKVYGTSCVGTKPGSRIEKDPIITEIEGGNSYKWIWVKEEMKCDFIEVVLGFEKINSTDFVELWILLSSLLILAYVKKIKHKKHLALFF